MKIAETLAIDYDKNQFLIGKSLDKLHYYGKDYNIDVK
jgi:hypothetical protein